MSVDAVEKSSRPVLVIAIVVLCVPSSYLGLLSVVYLFIDPVHVKHSELYLALTTMASLISGAFGFYLFGLGAVLWIALMTKPSAAVSRVIATACLLLALAGLLFGNSAIQ
jgi:hypothetical protein